MSDFNKTQPTPASPTATEAAARTSDAPVTGHVEAPKAGNAADNFEVGKGVGNSRRGIH